MTYDREKYSSTGRRAGQPPKPKPVKHVVKDEAHCIKIEVWAYRKMTDDEVAAEIKTWMRGRTMKELTPWRTYRIQLERT